MKIEIIATQGVKIIKEFCVDFVDFNNAVITINDVTVIIRKRME
jgi:hypothetical protein